MTVSTSYFPLQGGLNLESPPLATNPGELIDCVNYQCLARGGYQRILGYERFSGEPIAYQAVPGTGPVRGVHVYKGDVYAIRDENGVYGRMYKSTPTGWLLVSSIHVWSPGATYRFTNYNFYGQDDQETMYIVNGVDKACQWDGTTLTEITTGTGADNPSSVIGFKFHLFLGVESSLVNSAIGNPLDYQAINGAGEIAVGDSITDLEVAKGALIIACQDSTQALYGSSTSDFALEKMNTSGTVAATLANIGGQVIGLDRSGVMSLSATSNFGNFDYSSLTKKVSKYIRSFGEASHAAINRTYNQYRIFNGTDGLYLTFSGEQLEGISRVKFDHNVSCICNGLDSNRNEVSFFGSDDGNVYKMDTGYKFDGASIPSYLVTSFHHFGGPTRQKRFRLVQPDLRVEGAAHKIGISGTTDYGAGFITNYLSDDIKTGDLISTGGGLWDYSTWEAFTYDSFYHIDAKARVSIIGTNMAILISSDGSADGNHTIYGVTVHHSPRRLKR